MRPPGAAAVLMGRRMSATPAGTKLSTTSSACCAATLAPARPSTAIPLSGIGFRSPGSRAANRAVRVVAPASRPLPPRHSIVSRMR